MGIKRIFLEQKLNEVMEDGEMSKMFEIISQDKKLAGEILSKIQDSDNFSEIVKEAMNGWDKILEQNRLTNVEVTNMIQETRSGLQKYLDENIELLSKEERKEVLTQILELAKMMMQFDRDNKNFLLKMAGIVGTGVVVIGIASVAVISQKQDVIEMSKEKDDAN